LGKRRDKRDGTYGWPLKDRRDLLNALAAFRLGRYAPADKAALRQFIIRRAVAMKLAEELPPGWARPATRPGPREREQ
jgi:hypothetical protein